MEDELCKEICSSKRPQTQSSQRAELWGWDPTSYDTGGTLEPWGTRDLPRSPRELQRKARHQFLSWHLGQRHLLATGHAHTEKRRQWILLSEELCCRGLCSLSHRGQTTARGGLGWAFGSGVGELLRACHQGGWGGDLFRCAFSLSLTN
jgi:hypothetical protein